MPQGNLFFPSVNSAGVQAPSKLDATTSALLTSQALGKYGSAALNGRLYSGANPTGVTLSAALATTYVGLVLSNPAASTKKLALLRAKAVLDVAPAAFTPIGLIKGYIAAGLVTHTTALVANPNLLGSAVAAQATVDSAATLPSTPVWDRWLGVSISATGEFQVSEDVDGDIIIPPGGFVAFAASIAGPTSGFLGSFLWEEF